MSDTTHRDYQEAVMDLLAATVREIEARDALTEACDAQGSSSDPWLGAVAQAKRQAVYAADNDREEAAERYVFCWRRVGEKHVGPAGVLGSRVGPDEDVAS